MKIIKHVFTIVIWLTFISQSIAQSMKVLDSPYIYSKFHLFEPHPSWTFNRSEDAVFFNVLRSEATELLKPLNKVQPIYKWSYLYSEPEYIRSRVTKIIYLKDLENFNQSLKPKYLYKTTENKYSDEEEYNAINLEFHLPHYVNSFLGANLDEIRAGTIKYGRKKSFLNRLQPNIDALIEIGCLLKEGSTIKQNFNYYPDSIPLLSFKSIVLACLKNESLSPYTNRKFLKDLDKDIAIEKVNNNSIESVQIKEDYYIDIITGKLTSLIMGMGFYSDSGEELFWVYYPEFRWQLQYYYTIYNQKAIAYDYLFDNHLFDYKVEKIEHEPELARINFDYKYSVKLDPLIAIALHKENRISDVKNGQNIYKAEHGLKELSIEYRKGIVNGPITEKYENGNISFKGQMKEGECDGEFRFYHKNGSLKAIRNYENGILQGNQFNYYPNGIEYAKYFVKDDIIQSLKRLYEDGSLMEDGAFDDGLFMNDWTYRIKCDSSALNILKKYHEHFKDKPIKIENGVFSYKVRYQLNPEKHGLPYINMYRYRDVRFVTTFID